MSCRSAGGARRSAQTGEPVADQRARVRAHHQQVAVDELQLTPWSQARGEAPCSPRAGTAPRRRPRKLMTPYSPARAGRSSQREAPAGLDLLDQRPQRHQPSRSGCEGVTEARVEDHRGQSRRVSIDVGAHLLESRNLVEAIDHSVGADVICEERKRDVEQAAARRRPANSAAARRRQSSGRAATDGRGRRTAKLPVQTPPRSASRTLRGPRVTPQSRSPERKRCSDVGDFTSASGRPPSISSPRSSRSASPTYVVSRRARPRRPTRRSA